ncbi:unnamed protein product, partial [Ilex paraguariensis]
AKFDAQLSQYDESDRTPALRDQIFHKLFGEDGHGYCKTYGTSVPRSLVYQKDTSSSDTPNSAFIEKICHVVCEKLEPQIKAEFDKVHARIGLLESQADSVPDTSSAHQLLRELDEEIPPRSIEKSSIPSPSTLPSNEVLLKW